MGNSNSSLRIASVDSEHYVLGAILAKYEDVDMTDIVNRLTPDHFPGSSVTREAWKLIADMHARGDDIDFYPVAEALKARGTIQSTTDIHGWLNGPFGNVMIVIRELETTFKRRRIARVSEMLSSHAASGDVDQLAILARQELDAVIDSGKVESSSASELANEISARIDKGPSFSRPRPTGLRLLDWHLNGGFRPGQLVTVGARSSHGKTALGVCNFAVSAAECGMSAHVVTLEMPAVELAARIVSSLSSIGVGEILSNSIEDHEMVKVVGGIAKLSRLPITVASPRDKRLSNLIRTVRSSVRRDRAEIVIVDYLQLIRHDRQAMPRFEAVAEISGAFKTMAMELNIPIVILAQLNRQADGEAPRSAHLRESGAIEQDSDVVILIHRPDDDDGKPQDLGYLIVDKNRNGKQGRVPVEFVGFRCAFAPSNKEPIMPARRKK